MRFFSLAFFLASFLLFPITLFSQFAIDFTSLNNNATFNTCNGFIIDSGGQGGTGYSNNENITITICPDTPGDIISIVFNLFSLDPTNTGTQNNPNVDYMAVFDGNSVAANTLGTYTTNQLQGVVIQATALNPTGCITLQFYSNGVGTGMFTASATCQTPCNNPQAGGIIVGGITPDSIRVCLNQNIDFQDQGSFAQPGFNLVDYNWDFMDGTTANGQNVTHSYSIPGEYKVQLFVTDDNGCSNPNLIDLTVLVETLPDFSTFPGDTTICLGESYSVSADPDSYEVEWTGFVGSLTIDDGCLPDTLLGVSQDIQLMQTGFYSGTTIANVNDIQDICLELEHSYMGDLVIMIECPNGQNAILHQQGGGGTQIGIPVQADNVDCSDPSTMGVPFTYCFAPGATETWVEWVANNPFTNTIPGGTYESIDPLSNLVGCPTNGIWTLTVIDNWALDDGTLFSFGLNLDPSYYPSVTNFTPDIGAGLDSSYWFNPIFQTSLSADGNDLVVLPDTSGSFTYQYFVHNDFGCTHDTSFVLTVNENPVPFAGNDTTICGGSAIQLDGQVVGAVSDCNYILNLDDTFGDGWNGNTITITINGVATDYTIATGLSNSINLTVPVGATVFYTFNAIGSFVNECSFQVLDDNGNIIVSEGPGLAGSISGNWLSNCSPDLVYEWAPTNVFNDPSILDPIANINSQDTLTLTIYPQGHPLCTNSDDIIIYTSDVPNPGIDSTIQVCASGLPVDLFQFLGPNASSNGSWTNPLGVSLIMPYDPQTMPFGDYIYEVDSNGCVDQAIITVTELTTMITDTLINQVSCYGYNDGSFTIIGNNIDSYSINGGTTIFSANTFTVDGLTAGVYNVIVYSTQGCSDNIEIIVTEPSELTATYIPTAASCYGECDGSVIVIPSGGTPGYSYSWLGGVNGDQLGNGIMLCAGDYIINVLDSNNCLFELNYSITEPNNVFPSIIGDTLSGCLPHTVNFINTTPSTNILSTSVDFGDGVIEVINGNDDFSHTYQFSGLYSVTVTILTDDSCEYVISYNDLVQVYDYPTADFMISPNNVISFNPVVSLFDQSSVDVTSWNWEIDSGNPNSSVNEDVNNVVFPLLETADYPVTLIVSNAYGCNDTVTKYVSVVDDVIIYAPNTFTPDNDEYNQVWNIHIIGIDVYQFDLYIYNRWGELIWESHDPSIGWDGTFNGGIVQDGMYNWVIDCKDLVNDEKYRFNGYVTIIK
ncbi:MAG: hypothetical protein CL844_05200 [Crocinitomicaceae bacterium]|nr:hypothetical protein [Crocinitomicaceae bacterium]|tara:strand:- start:1614 stop:5270 length:3657 start_codon:yes stop_codon:yes gene_type:complete